MLFESHNQIIVKLGSRYHKISWITEHWEKWYPSVYEVTIYTGDTLTPYARMAFDGIERTNDQPGYQVHWAGDFENFDLEYIEITEGLNIQDFKRDPIPYLVEWVL